MRTAGPGVTDRVFRSLLARMRPAPADEAVHIRPDDGRGRLSLGEVWRYRELLYFLMLRDVRLRYRQTVFGASWVIAQPLFTMIVFSVFFGTLGGLSGRVPGNIPYPLYVTAALITWQAFSAALIQSSNSLVGEQRLLTKVYFPRLVVPLSAVLPCLVDFLVALSLVGGLMAWYGVAPGPQILLAPVIAAGALAAALAVGLWLSALNVRFRDVRNAVPFAVQLWFYLTPIAYPSSIVPEQFRGLYALNPMVSVVEAMRWSLLGAPPPALGSVLLSAAVVAAVLVTGLSYFQRAERTFADVV